MGSSELSDALNPYYSQYGQYSQSSQSRNQQQSMSLYSNFQNFQPTSQNQSQSQPHSPQFQAQPYIATGLSPQFHPQQITVQSSGGIEPSLQLQVASPHNSHAIPVQHSELHIQGNIHQQQQSSPLTRARPSPGGLQAVQELLRIVSATKDAQEAERERRIAWEKEQEMKQETRQAELEKQVLELRQEVLTLRQVVSRNDSVHQASMALSIAPPPPPHSQNHSQLPTPVSVSPAEFVQGSSTQPYQSPVFIHQHHSPPVTETDRSSFSQSVSPAVSPALLDAPIPSKTANISSESPANSRSNSNLRQTRSPTPPKTNKRSRKGSRRSSSLSSSDSGSSESSTYSRPLRKRRNNHDKRCLTIQHAMRMHVLRLMAVESDKELPETHSGDQPLGPEDPIRFVWDKTTKQCVHNMRMKARIVEDLKENHRRLYKHVPEKDFSKKMLDSAFDQYFTTLRQKFKAQKDDQLAEHQKEREGMKAMKARRLLRKKAKLDTRASARLKVTAFEHSTFDSAFEIDCMSSEESEVDEDADQDSRRTRSSAKQPKKRLVTRPLSWRSHRLVKFYQALDEEDRVSGPSAKQKRGVGKLERVTGPRKDGFHLPPKGVAGWMVSQRWLVDEQSAHPDLPQVVDHLVVESPPIDWNDLGRFELAEGSEDEDAPAQTTAGLATVIPHTHGHEHLSPHLQAHPEAMPMQMPPHPSHHYDGSSLQYAFG